MWPALPLYIPRAMGMPAELPQPPATAPGLPARATQVPDPPSRKVRDSILSRLRGSRPTPAESLNLSPSLSPPRNRARAPALGKHAARGGQGLAGAMSDRQPLKGPSAASDALHGGVSPYPGVCSRCIPAWDRPRSTARPGVNTQLPCAWFGGPWFLMRRAPCSACAVPPCSPAGAVALSGNLGVSSSCVCTQPELSMGPPH